MSVVVPPMKLSDILQGKKSSPAPSTPKRKTKQLKVPGAPKRARKGVIARTLFFADVVNPTAAKKKKSKNNAKHVALPKTVYIVMNETRKEPVSAHRTQIGAQKRYWAETAATGECYEIVACKSGKE